MLRLVHDDKMRGGDYADPYRRDEYDDDHDRGRSYAEPPPPARPRPRRRSVALRVAMSGLLAVVLGAAGGGVYLAVRDGLLQPLFAPVPARAPAAQLAAATAPPATAAPVQSAPAATAPVMPQTATLVLLIRNAIVALHQANLAGNYSVFRAIAAPGLQAVATPATLGQAFADIRNRGLDLAEITTANPRLYRDPAFDEKGRLRLTGFFPLAVGQVEFDMLFEPVNGRWMLFGLAINPSKDAKPAPAPKTAAAAKPTIPDGPKLVELVRGAVIALNQANISGDYSVLREMGSAGFRQANTDAAIAANFAALRARQIDLAPVAVIEPKLFRPPAIDDHGFLRLTGFFPSQPEQVNFDLAFQQEAGVWHLFGIGLNTSREEPVPADAPPATADAKTGPGGVPMPRLRPQS